MSPLIKKEIRLLLPAWTAAMLLAIVPMGIAVWSHGHAQPRSYILLALALGFILLGITSFGQEFSSGTFTLLLSQPIERRRIWFVKTTILAAAFISVLLIPVVSEELYSFQLPFNRLAILTILKDAGITMLSAFTLLSSGLWATLLLRRISEAFWITLLTPVAIAVTLYAFHELFHWSNQTDDVVVPAVFLIYSLAGSFWAGRLFLRAQDLQWTGGVIAFSSRKRISEPANVSSRTRHWLSALVWKELQLQQVNILIAVVVLALHLTSVLIRGLNPNFINPNVLGLLVLMWGLWLAMPLLIGSAAVAEERRVGVTESQFCLPVSRRSQFLIKFITGLILSLVLGGAMPFIIERARDFNGWMFAVAAAIFFISFYASTLARTTLQAIGLTLVLSPAIYLYLVGEAIAIAKLGHNYTYSSLGLALLRVRLGVPILLLVLACLTLGNFKWLLPDWKLWRRNLITVLSAFATLYILSHAIYFRAWELLVPCPQPQGPARLSASSPTKFAFIFNTLSAVLPDGRLWIETLAYEYSGNGVTLAPERFKASFIDGSNWTDVAQSWLQILAIQSDGSLWRAEKKFIGGAGWGYEIGKFSRFDSQTNWQGVVASRYGNGGFLLLTKEGALWNWGTNWARTSSQKLVLDSKATPNQIDQETNWTEVLSLGGYACARNQNGNVWRWDMTGTNSTFHLVQETNSEFALSLADNESWRAMVSGDGELWLSWSTWANNYWHVSGTNRIGSDSKWKAVAFANNFLIALRRDGTLWRWRVSEVFAPVAHSDKPTQVGNYSHWIVLDDMGAVSLAADGTIWGWDHPSRYKWLAPSRRPVYLGNIFITQ